MEKHFIKLYLINVLNLFIISLLAEMFFTLICNYPNEKLNFTGINIWLLFTIILIYQLLKKIKTDLATFLIYFFICILLLFIFSRYFTIFDFFEPNFYGFNKKLYFLLPTNLDHDVKRFLFWQTGISSGFNFEVNTTNKIVIFFTVPPVAIIECLLKSIFPNLYIILLIQLPLIFIKKNIILWTKN